MDITIVAAVAQDGAIGFENKLLFYIPADLKHFKEQTTGSTIVMGRKTFESLPKGALPNRRNIVLSRSKKEFPGTTSFESLQAALDHCAGDERIFIIGGATVYEQALPVASKLCITHIAAVPEQADTYFPSISPDEWEETSRQHNEADEKNLYDYDFVCYKRKTNH